MLIVFEIIFYLSYRNLMVGTRVMVIWLLMWAMKMTHLEHIMVNTVVVALAEPTLLRMALPLLEVVQVVVGPLPTFLLPLAQPPHSSSRTRMALEGKSLVLQAVSPQHPMDSHTPSHQHLAVVLQQQRRQQQQQRQQDFPQGFLLGLQDLETCQLGIHTKMVHHPKLWELYH